MTDCEKCGKVMGWGSAVIPFNPATPKDEFWEVEVNFCKECNIVKILKTFKADYHAEVVPISPRRMKCFLDGNSLCVVRENFKDLQESPSMFLDLTKDQIKEFRRLKDD